MTVTLLDTGVLYAAIDRSGDLSPDDVRRAAQLVETYADLRLGLVDASVIALAERLGIHQVATIDRRHFTIIRPRHVSALTLLPLAL